MTRRLPDRITLTLLGGFQARTEAAPLAFPTRKAQALVAYLGMKPGHVHTREKLAALFWGDTVEDRARNSLRQTVFAIRRAFGSIKSPCLVSEGETLALDPARVDVDVAQFERLGHEKAPESLAAAIALYKGDLLEGLNLKELAFDEWLLAERERLRELAVDALAQLLAQQAKSGATEAAIQTASRLVTIDPLQESVHRTLMRLYAHQGRRAAALKQYRTCAAVLKSELGVDVEARTKQLHDQIEASRTLDAGPADPVVVKRTPKRGPHGTSILVVEDDLVTRAMLEKFLAGEGYEVVVAADGSDALRQLGKRPFDMVLSDIQMPTLDGLQLLQTMGEKGIQTPAVFLTAMTGLEQELAGLQVGAADYIRKPVQKEILLLRVRNVLNRA
jgi:DNA-binding SARP family transcriptional activator/CheY-like chemotaxis protein